MGINEDEYQNRPEIAVEEEDLGTGNLMERPFNPKEIDIATKTLSLDTIIKRLEYNDIDLNTEFQRNMDLWSKDKQSRLIESILIKFPLPAFYFDGSDNDKWLVVDGLQRLSAINNFVIKNKLKLEGLEFLSQLEGKKYSDLSRSLQRQINEAQIVAYVINPGTPKKVKFNIFKRINTGGLFLTSQEIRHALNQGTAAQFVKELADLNSFKKATDNSIRTERMLDREFANRFMAFYLTPPENYRSDLDTFLNDAMVLIANETKAKRDEVKYNFNQSMLLAYDVFNKFAFRKVPSRFDRRRPINKALFEVWSVVFSKLSDKERNKLKNKKNSDELFDSFIRLQNKDERFFESISSATGDRSRVLYRFKVIKELVTQYL